MRAWGVLRLIVLAAVIGLAGAFLLSPNAPSLALDEVARAFAPLNGTPDAAATQAVATFAAALSAPPAFAAEWSATPTPPPTSTPSPTVTLTARATATPDGAATAVLLQRQINRAVAATLTAQPTATPLPTLTPAAALPPEKLRYPP